MSNTYALSGDDRVNSLIAGPKWLAQGPGLPTVIPYSFATSATGPERDSFVPFNESLRTATREALQKFMQDANLKFVEVPEGGAITFGMADKGKGTGNPAWTYQLTRDTSGLSSPNAVRVFLSTAYDILRDGNAPETIHILLHEIGHALGLKHPEDDDVTDHPPYYPMTWIDSNMSYIHLGGVPITPQPRDIDTLVFIYGETTAPKEGNLTYHFPGFAVQSTIVNGEGGTLDASEFSVGVKMNLNAGATSSVSDIAYMVTIADDSIANGIGGSGNDTMIGNPHANTLKGGEGNDIISGNDGNDVINGDVGNDVLAGDAGDDTIFGGTGNDVMFGGPGNDTLAGDDGNDIIVGNDGNDMIFGGEGDDTANGGDGADAMNGGRDNDFFGGGAGNDTISGGDGGDVLNGEDGNDVLNGNNGDDVAIGGAGNDVVGGGAGDDSLFGNAGDDLIFGEEGNDFIIGGAGNDTFVGGAGNDTFLVVPGDGFDTITDFAAGGTDDTIWFAGTNLRSFEDVLRVAHLDAGKITSEIVGPGFSVTLSGVSPAQLTAADFIFT